MQNSALARDVTYQPSIGGRARLVLARPPGFRPNLRSRTGPERVSLAGSDPAS